MPYRNEGMSEGLAGHFRLTKEQSPRPGQMAPTVLATSWTGTAEFTATGVHTGCNGQEHKSPDHLYFLTTYGYAVAERKVQKPKANRHGPRNAKPDIRQLTEEQRRIAPWLNQNGRERSDLDKVLGILAEKRTKY